MKAHFVVALALATACSAPEIEIAGTWTDGFGTFTVQDDTYTYDGTVIHITTWDNDADWAVGQNDAANEYFPELWTHFDWTVDGGVTYLCQSTFDAESEQAAIDAAPADAADLSTGCSGYPWSTLEAVPVNE